MILEEKYIMIFKLLKKIHIQIFLGIILGIFFGYLLPDQVKYIEWIGVLFMRALKMIIVPLVLTSLITGITNIGSAGGFGRLSAKTMVYYITTSLLAILTGLFFVNIFKPGQGISLDIFKDEGVMELSDKTLYDTFIEIIPENIFEVFSSNNYLLSVIFFALIVGVTITKLNDKPKEYLTNLFSSFFDLMMKLTLIIMKFTPIGVFGLIAVSVSEQSNLGVLLVGLKNYAFTVLVALLFHFVITLPAILYFVAKINPYKHFKAMLTPLITAFSTASSNATLPLTIENIENKSRVSNKISSFTLPLGATINMDGTALYELIAVGFIAQLAGMELTITKQFIMVTTALLASIGTAAIPMASLTTMSIIFTAIGLDIRYMAIILPVDRPLDMCRTATNVWSDTCCAVTIAKSEGEKIYDDDIIPDSNKK